MSKWASDRPSLHLYPVSGVKAKKSPSRGGRIGLIERIATQSLEAEIVNSVETVLGKARWPCPRVLPVLRSEYDPMASVYPSYWSFNHLCGQNAYQLPLQPIGNGRRSSGAFILGQKPAFRPMAMARIPVSAALLPISSMP